MTRKRIASAVLVAAFSLTSISVSFADSSYYGQEQDRERTAKDRQRRAGDARAEEYQREKWQADRNAEKAAEKRGDWNAARGYAKWEDYRAKQYWNDRNQVARDSSAVRGDRTRCKRDGTFC